MTQSVPDEHLDEEDVITAGTADVDSESTSGDEVDVEQLLEQVLRLETEVEDLRGQQARALADYQNLRRRSVEERQERDRMAQKVMLLNYLPILDDLMRALDSVDEHPEIAEHRWLEGVRIVRRKFLGVLESGGVTEIESLGCTFDPELHEAVAYEPGLDGTVVAVVQTGYAIDGLVIRPAMVLVGNGDTSVDDQTTVPEGVEIGPGVIDEMAEGSSETN